MKRKSIALLLALMMCLALLSACGGDNTPETSEPPSSESTTQPTTESEKPEESKEQPEGQEETEEPGETEEPNPEETKQEEHEGTKLLALLKEEWENGFVEGEGARHTYINYNKGRGTIYNGVVYLLGLRENENVSTYDIASKELRGVVLAVGSNNNYYGPSYFLDGNFYLPNIRPAGKESEGTEVYDCNGTFLNSFQEYFDKICFYEHGILTKPSSLNRFVFLSHNLEKNTEIPPPQREVEHGQKQAIKLSDCRSFAADGTVYLYHSSSKNMFRLNTDTYEWETVDVTVVPWRNTATGFCGKYVASTSCNSICDWVSGEKIFNWNEAGVYPPVSATQYRDNYLCYFGGDQYLGYSDREKEYRWVNLKDLTMSDPLPLPNVRSDELTILNDTYCVYYDNYGWFLLNYNDGTEETILMFNQ